jgi:DNA-binding NarL/FixJ family response regulator
MRIVLADDSVLLREGVARLLGEAGFQVVGQAGDADGLLRQVAMHQPDVAIVDIRMPPETDGGLRAARQIRSAHPGVGVLVLSQYARPSYAFELLSDSAERVGYLLKDRVADLAALADAVRRVNLTEREREVLALMAEGRSNQAIADRLVITERTVEKHVNGIFAKLRLPASPDDHRRVLAVLAYLRA